MPDERLQASLQHVVVTFDPVNGRRIYVNGEFTGDVDRAGGGTLARLGRQFAFVLGNEVIEQPPVAGRDAPRRDPQPRADAAADPAELRRPASARSTSCCSTSAHLVNVPQAYIMFEASQFDSYGYLFTKPTFISLDPARAMPGSIPIKGMRIGVNGAEADGRARRIACSTRRSRTALLRPPPASRLSNVGTVIALEKGPDADEFFLTFDVLGTHSNVRLDPVPPVHRRPPPTCRRPADDRHAHVRRDQRDDGRSSRA